MMPDFGQQTLSQMPQEQMMQMMQMMMQMMQQQRLPLAPQVAPGLWPTLSPSFEPAESKSPTVVTDAICADFAEVAAQVRDFLAVGGMTPFPIEKYRSAFSQAALINASLEALARCGSESDITFVYRYLNVPAVPACIIISLFKQFGNDEDARDIARRISGATDERMLQILVAVLFSFDGSAMRREIERILDVFPDNVGELMDSLLKSSEAERDSFETVVSLLTHRRIKVRRGAVAVLARERRGDRMFFERLLLSDMQNYFDVLCWLDRLAYAPGFISEYFYDVLLKVDSGT